MGSEHERQPVKLFVIQFSIIIFVVVAVVAIDVVLTLQGVE